MKRFGKIAFGLLLAAAAWTILASLVFLNATGLAASFAHPFWQWWLYVADARTRANPIVAEWLEISGGAASVVVLIAASGLVFRRRTANPSLRRKLSGRMAAPIRGATDNFGHAEWLSIAKARELFAGPSESHGGIVIGEAYRVDEDSVAATAFDPARRSTWGRGGRAPLLIDPCNAGPTHSLVFAGAGSFKSTSAATTLLTWTGPVVVLDPSCELGPMLSRARQAMGHNVYQIGLHDGLGFNVLDWIDIASPLATTNVLSVVAWICGDAAPGVDQSAEFFASRGRALVACLLAHMLWSPEFPPEAKTLAMLRRGLSTPEDGLREMLAGIEQSSPSPLARDYAGTLRGLVAETFSGIYANADESTAWLANPAFAAIVSGNSFKTSELLGGRCSIFLQLPLMTLQTTPAVARTIVGALLNAAYEADGAMEGRILYLLDEAARLGPMKIIETARDAGRKYGITLQLLYQSVGQLEKQWGKDGKREWYDGVSHRSYAAIQDLETARELEETFGTYAVMTALEGQNTGSSGKPFEMHARSRGSNVSYSETSRPLIRREELMNDCRTDEAFIIVRGARPLRCGRAIYFRRPELVKRVDRSRFANSANAAE